MAKNQAPKNKSKKLAAAPAAAPAAAEAAPGQKMIEGQSQDLVRVEYKKENHHILHHVHALRPGINHIPAAVLEQALKHPANAKLLADGDLVILDQDEAEEEAEETDGGDDADLGAAGDDPATGGDGAPPAVN